MALSDRASVVVTAYNDLVFAWSAAQDAVLGQSRVDWQLILEAGAYGRIDATPGSRWAVNIDGQEFSGATSIAVGNDQTKVLAEGSVVLGHDENGEKHFPFSFSQEFFITFDGAYIESVTGYGYAVLDPMDPDAAPLLSAASAYLGETVTVTPQGPAGAEFRLEYQLGTVSGTIGEGLTGPVEWVVPESLGEQFPYAAEAPVRILCAAYIDGARVGRQREAALVAKVPEAAVPQVENITVSDVSAAGELGLLVQNVSRLKVEAECAGAMGSRVAERWFTLGGKRTELLTEAGEVPLVVTVRDTRGRVGSRGETLTVEAYSPPRVRLSAHRCREDGTADDTGQWARITVTAQWQALPGNSGQVVLTAGQIRETWTEQGERVLLVEAPGEKTMDIQATVTDRLGSGSAGLALSTAYCTMDLLYGGRGIAFGTVAAAEGFHCAMDTRFSGKVTLSDGTELLERLKLIEEKMGIRTGSSS